jgi:hypothetical protein
MSDYSPPSPQPVREQYKSLTGPLRSRMSLGHFRGMHDEPQSRGAAERVRRRILELLLARALPRRRCRRVPSEPGQPV